jgi:PD-(D/E)XK nuclease superfamily
MGAIATLKHADVTERIIGVFYDAYNELGYGFLECVYEESLVIALTDAGLTAIVRYICQSGFAVIKSVNSERTCWSNTAFCSN